MCILHLFVYMISLLYIHTKQNIQIYAHIYEDNLLIFMNASVYTSY